MKYDLDHFRAHVLARYDGIESFARIVGTALSPIVFDAAGYYASFAIRYTPSKKPTHGAQSIPSLLVHSL